MRLHLLVVIVAIASACQPEEGSPQIVLTLPDGTECDEQSADCAFEFGVVTAEEGSTVAFKLKNTGDGDGVVTDVTLVGDRAITLVDKPGDIAAGAAADISFHAENAPVRSTANVSIAWESPESVIHLQLGAGDGSAAHLSLDPVACDFGAVAEGDAADCAITLASDGARDLVIDAVEIAAGDDVFSLSESPSVTTVPAGQSTTAVVTARPNGAGVASGLLRIGSNDPQNGGSVFVTLTVASPPHLVLPDEGCDFGDVTVGDLATCDVVIGNDGFADLVLTNIEVRGDLNALGLTEAPPDPLVIHPGDTRRITTASAPPEEGTFDGTLEFDTNDPDDPHGAVPLHVNGVP